MFRVTTKIQWCSAIFQYNGSEIFISFVHTQGHCDGEICCSDVENEANWYLQESFQKQLIGLIKNNVDWERIWKFNATDVKFYDW